MLENGYISGDFEKSKFMANPFSKDMGESALLKRAVDYYFSQQTKKRTLPKCP